LYLQVVGRVLRPYPGKTSALVIDLRGSVHEHGQPAEDRTYSLTGEAISTPTAGPRHCPVCTSPLKLTDRTCACGWSVEEVEAPKVVSTPLVKFAAKRRETDDQRAASLARWLNEAKVKGHKDGAAYYKYQAVYGGWPSTAIKTKAKGYR
jgi:superfamily II DNA or RNA helicase